MELDKCSIALRSLLMLSVLSILEKLSNIWSTWWSCFWQLLGRRCERYCCFRWLNNSWGMGKFI